MKKNLIRLFSMISALGLMVTAAGCGTTTEVVSEIQTEVISGGNGSYVSGTEGTQGSSGTSGSNGTQNNSSGFDNAKGDKDSVDTSGGTDLKGATVTISKWGVGAGPQKGSSTYQQETQLVADIEKKYNCKLKFTNVSDSMGYFNQTVGEMQAGNSADIVFLPGDMAFPSTVINGYFHELDSLVNLKDLQWNQSALSQMVIKGKHHFVSPAINTGNLAGAGVFFNKKMFASANVKTPEEYVKANNWNWDTFKEVAQKMTGNGKVGISSYSANNYGTTFALTSNGVRPVINNNGKRTLNLNNSAAIAAINLSGELKKNGWIAKGENNFKEGKSAMTFADYYMSPDYIDALGKNTVGFTFLPLGPNAKDYSQVYVGTSVEVVGIPVKKNKAKDPKVLAQIMNDFTARYSWRKSAEQALESYFDDAASLSRAVKMAEYAYAKLDLQSYYGETTDKIFRGDYGIDAGQSAQAYVQANAAKAQADIDAVWKGSN